MCSDSQETCYHRRKFRVCLIQNTDEGDCAEIIKLIKRPGPQLKSTFRNSMMGLYFTSNHGWETLMLTMLWTFSLKLLKQ